TADEQRAGSPLHDRCKGGIELDFTCRLHDQDCRPMARPAASRSRNSTSNSGRFGSPSTATMAALGASSCNSPSCLAAKSVVVKTTPVTLPPGRLRLATKPVLTGSKPVVKTIGIVAVAALTAGTATPFA